MKPSCGEDAGASLAAVGTVRPVTRAPSGEPVPHGGRSHTRGETATSLYVVMIHEKCKFQTLFRSIYRPILRAATKCIWGYFHFVDFQIIANSTENRMSCIHRRHLFLPSHLDQLPRHRAGKAHESPPDREMKERTGVSDECHQHDPQRDARGKPPDSAGDTVACVSIGLGAHFRARYLIENMVGPAGFEPTTTPL